MSSVHLHLLVTDFHAKELGPETLLCIAEDTNKQFIRAQDPYSRVLVTLSWLVNRDRVCT